MAISNLLTIEKQDGVTVIGFDESASSIQGAVTEDLAPTLLNEAGQAAPRILVDLDGVEFFNSSFIELLVRTWNRVKVRPGGRFAICNVQPYCREILDVTNLTTVWKVYPSRQSAIDSFQPGSDDDLAD